MWLLVCTESVGFLPCQCLHLKATPGLEDDCPETMYDNIWRISESNFSKVKSASERRSLTFAGVIMDEGGPSLCIKITPVRRRVSKSYITLASFSAPG